MIKSTHSRLVCRELLITGLSLVALCAHVPSSFAALTCEGDPTRTVLASGQGRDDPPASCHQFDGNQATCLQAFHVGGDGVASCFYDLVEDECRGCGTSRNERDGDCVNTCATTPVCAADPTRTLFTGGPSSGSGGGACRTYDGDQTSCLMAFHRSSLGGLASCWWDAPNNDCRGCGPDNASDGDCTNTCITSPVCAQDPGRTIFVGGPQSNACRTLDDDPTMCVQAYHLSGDEQYASCFPTVRCTSCGGNNRGDLVSPSGGAAGGRPDDADSTGCINDCIPVPTCADASKTTYVGGPSTDACRSLNGDAAACNVAYHTGRHGVATCWYDAIDDECRGCGPSHEGDGDCTNTCDVAPTCLDATRTTFLGGPRAGQNGGACRQAADQTACESSYHKSGDDLASSCFWDGSGCLGCGENNRRDGDCTDTCQPAPACTADPTRTNLAFGRGTSGGACRQYDDDETNCNISFHFDNNNSPAACFFDEGSGACRGCGPDNEGRGLCTNTCATTPVCTLDPTRTIFTGHPDSEGCHRFDGNPTSCAQAYVLGQFSLESCYYDASNDTCRGCGPFNLTEGRCTNSCAPTATCPSNLTRNTLGACDDATTTVACDDRFELTPDGPVSCFNQSLCLGCGIFNQEDAMCINTCEDGPGSGTETGSCDDGVDNDTDGAIDCGDTDCAGDPACAAPAPAMSWQGLMIGMLLLGAIGVYRLRTRDS